MTRQRPPRGGGALLAAAALLLVGATPVASHAQAAAAPADSAATAAGASSGAAALKAAAVKAATLEAAATPPARTPVGRAPKDSSLLSFDREVYNYVADGRRDPFQSLMATGELRPLITDLRLVAVAYDAGGGSVAVLRDLGTNEQYRVRAGQQLGRMRVAAIQPKKVVFTIEEFGYSRQESLALGDLTNARTQQ